MPLEFERNFVNEKEVLYEQANLIYGRQGDYYLDELEIGIMLEESEVIDLTTIAVSDAVEKAIEDAELFMA